MALRTVHCAALVNTSGPQGYNAVIKVHTKLRFCKSRVRKFSRTIAGALAAANHHNAISLR